jgi:arylsulfatase A-like enzyme
VPERPNIVLILADDLGYSDIGCYGGEIRTPNLDRLGREGVRFRQFFNTARCSPSRASLLTGLHPHQTGIGILTDEDPPGGYPGSLNDQCATLPEMLSADGYATGLSGKWHMSSSLTEPADSWPTRRGFAHFYGLIAGCGSYYTPGTLFRGERDASADTEDPAFLLTQAIADDAVAFIREATEAERPFFSYVAFTAPHWPLHAPESDIAAYDGVFDAGWDTLREQRLTRQQDEGIIGPEARLSERDAEVPAWDEIEDRAWWLRRMQVYAAQVDRMDRGIGLILDELERTGTLQDTIVVFLSDNGACAEELRFGDAQFAARRTIVPGATRDGRPMQVGNDPSLDPGPEDTYCSYGRAWANLSNTPFRLYKRWVHEGGIASPLIVHWPAGGLTDGAILDAPFQLPDFVPTILELTGVAYAGPAGRDLLPLEGESMLTALRGVPDGRAEPTLFWEHIGNCSLRRGDLKLVREYLGPWELYDLSESRTEEHDLAAERPQLLAELVAEWEAWADRVGVVPREQILRLYARRDGEPEHSRVGERTVQARSPDPTSS